MVQIMQQHPTVFLRGQIEATYRRDAFWVDLNARPEAVVDSTRYFCGLFSHRRVDFLWTGMLRVDLTAKAADDVAAAAIQQASALQSITTAAPTSAPAGSPAP